MCTPTSSAPTPPRPSTGIRMHLHSLHTQMHAHMCTPTSAHQRRLARNLLSQHWRRAAAAAVDQFGLRAAVEGQPHLNRQLQAQLRSRGDDKGARRVVYVVRHAGQGARASAAPAKCFSALHGECMESAWRLHGERRGVKHAGLTMAQAQPKHTHHRRARQSQVEPV